MLDLHTRIHAGIIRLAQIDRLHGQEQMNFYKYINSTVSKISKSNGSWDTAEIGDIIQLMSGGEASHSLIISGVAYSSYGRSDLLVCAHSTDRRHVSFERILFWNKNVIIISKDQNETFL